MKKLLIAALGLALVGCDKAPTKAELTQQMIANEAEISQLLNKKEERVVDFECRRIAGKHGISTGKYQVQIKGNVVKAISGGGTIMERRIPDIGYDKPVSTAPYPGYYIILTTPTVHGVKIRYNKEICRSVEYINLVKKRDDILVQLSAFK